MVTPLAGIERSKIEGLFYRRIGRTCPHPSKTFQWGASIHFAKLHFSKCFAKKLPILCLHDDPEAYSTQLKEHIVSRVLGRGSVSTPGTAALSS